MLLQAIRVVQGYLEEERALVLSLWAGGPEPVGERPGFGRGDEVAQRHGLLQDVHGLLVGLHAVRVVALQQNNNNKVVNNHNGSEHFRI